MKAAVINMGGAGLRARISWLSGLCLQGRGAALALAAAVTVLAGPGAGIAPAWATAGPWVDQEQARLRLVSAVDAAGSAEVLSLGLHFELQPGWKIYWRSPGDAGYPPSVDWSQSRNLAAAELQWPVPHRFSLFGLETFGYGEEVVLPVSARPERPGEPVSLRAHVSYLTCNEICIPREAMLSLDLAAGPGAAAPAADLIDSFRMRVPGLGPDPGMAIEDAVLTGPVDAPVLEVLASSQRPFSEPDVLIEAPPGFSFAAPEVRYSEGRTGAVLRVAAVATGGGVLDGKPLTLTLTDGGRGVERQVFARYADPKNLPAGITAAAPAATASGSVGPATLATILGLALLGGLILNLMPCVLPVLSIKLLSVVKHGGRAPAAVRISFLASAAGILASFLVLAGGAVLLKALGLTVGWGIQFQQPLFLAAMAVVVTLFACNLFGFYEIALPRWAQGAATLGQPIPGGDKEPSLAGHFLTGALATLLATPCSAPFLGTAVGFALARGAPEIFAIFSVLGLGLALPYLVIAALPAVATRLPRPGPWMVKLRIVLGLALLATALWLLSVLAAQLGAGAAGLVGALLTALTAVIWLGRSRPRRPHATAVATPALAAVLALAAIALPAGFETAGPGAAPAGESAAWQPFDPDEISRQVAQGRVVLVDVTADWCLTCRINKTLVIDRDPVRGRLGGDKVVTMRADWTLPNPAISDYLAGFGRYGIPFNAVYGPGAPQGIALPELLTADAVIAALERASGG